MSKKLSPKSSLENFRREAKRWLAALRENDPDARARLQSALGAAPNDASLRDVQHALAREYGFDGWTALAGALENSHSTADVTGLLDAAFRGDAARVADLLDANPDIVSARGLLRGHTGLRTALHHAVGGDQEAVVRLLLDRGADPNVRDEGDNAIPLHFAAEKEQLGMIAALVEHGSDMIGTGDYHELEIIGWATVFGSARRDVVDYLLSHGATHNILSAVATGSVAEIRALAAAEPDSVNKPMDSTNHHRRPLHLAIVKKQPSSLDALLDLAADVTATDDSGLTPLDQAALGGEFEMAERLLDRGAPISVPAAIVLDRDVERVLLGNPGVIAPGGRWATLIVRAAEQGSARVIETLLRNGASANTQDDPKTAIDGASGYTPLHAAAFRGNRDVAAVLLANGASVTIRDSKYHGTPAGWANYAGHHDVRDQILAGPIDMFDAVMFNRIDRLREIFDRDPGSLNQRMRDVVSRQPDPDDWTKAWWTPLALAVAIGDVDATRALLELGAEPEIRDPQKRTLLEVAREADNPAIVSLLEQYAPEARRVDGDLVARFLFNACPDHHIRGGHAHIVARETAARLLEQHPDLARENIYTAVVCGEIDYVRDALLQHPAAARDRGGPKGSSGGQPQQFVVDEETVAHPRWEPILYACFARLEHAATNDNAPAIVAQLLDHGADANAYFMAGDSRYSPLTAVIGEGEEARLPHPRRNELVRLLLQHGANPYDIQVLYNIHFHGRMLWYLEMIYEESKKRGRQADWDDPHWSMLDMGVYGCGARYVLSIAIHKNDRELAEWALLHGASPNAPPAPPRHWPKSSLYAEAIGFGFTEMAALLARYGAVTSEVTLDIQHQLRAACLHLDRAKIEALFARQPSLRTSHVAMHAAAERDRADVVSLLLELGVPSDVANPRRGNETPMHVAAYSDAPHAAERLIAAGAPVDVREASYGATPIGYAIYNQVTRMIDFLSRHSHDVWNLSLIGAVERVREVLAADPRLATLAWPDGTTPLMRLPGDEPRAMEIAALLVAAGAEAGAQNKNGESAVDLAEKRGMPRVAEFLRGLRRPGRSSPRGTV